MSPALVELRNVEPPVKGKHMLLWFKKNQCQWARKQDIPLSARLRRFLLDALPPVSTGELAFLAVGVVILVGLATWGINEAVEGMFIDLEQRMREAGGLGPTAERRP